MQLYQKFYLLFTVFFNDQPEALANRLIQIANFPINIRVFNGLKQHAPPVARIGYPAHEAGPFQTVDKTRNRASRQPAKVRKFACADRLMMTDDVERFKLSGTQAY